MPRHVLDESRIHPSVRAHVAGHQEDIVREVQDAVAAHAVVVVGLAWNPFVRKAQRALDEARIAHHDLVYGNYVSDWRRRNALKMWTGWPTFPMVFVKGVLVGGADDLKRLLASGDVQRMLA